MDTAWLAQEAKTIHQIFTNYFYILVSTLILLGVVLDYFKFAIGGTPQFTMLIGRALVASLLLMATPEIMNMLSSVTDAISQELGDMNKVKMVMNKMSEKVGTFSWSWASVKESLLLAISFVSFFILYIAVHIADALFLYTWMLLFVFSPVLIAFFVLPSTASATKGLFRSLIEVSGWKIVWSVLTSLLWSFAMVELDKPDSNISFLTMIVLNLMLFFSVIATPKITSALINGGLSQVASSFGDTFFNAAPFGLASAQQILQKPKQMTEAGVKTAVMGVKGYAMSKMASKAKSGEANKTGSKAHAKQQT